ALEEEPWVEVIADVLGDMDGKIRSADVWTILGIDPSRRTSGDDTRMGRAMRELGRTRAQRRYGANPDWGYVQGDAGQRIFVYRGPVEGVTVRYETELF